MVSMMLKFLGKCGGSYGLGPPGSVDGFCEEVTEPS